MTTENQIKRCFTQMIYGDALGFLLENNNDEKTMDLKSFHFLRDQQLEMNLCPGQWSDLSELALIITKCLVDEKEKFRVSLDYERIQEELKLWKYYRHGGSPGLLKRIKEGESYYQETLYHNDKRGYGFSRNMVIFLANKNFDTAKEEVVRQITYFNKHPQVILTGLLMGRIVYILLKNIDITREELINQLKDYLIELQRNQLTNNSGQGTTKKYILQFEQEKINYLMALDWIKSKKDISQQPKELDSQGILLAALENYWRLQGGLSPDLHLTPKNDHKEALALAYGFLGINYKTPGGSFTEIKDFKFIESMGDYIGRIRNYEVYRKPYEGSKEEIDLFQLKKGTVIKHPVLNITKVAGIKKGAQWIEVILETKTGAYKLYKKI